MNVPIWWICASTGACGYLIIWHMHMFKHLSKELRFAIDRFIYRTDEKSAPSLAALGVENTVSSM